MQISGNAFYFKNGGLALALLGGPCSALYTSGYAACIEPVYTEKAKPQHFQSHKDHLVYAILQGSTHIMYNEDFET